MVSGEMVIYLPKVTARTVKERVLGSVTMMMASYRTKVTKGTENEIDPGSFRRETGLLI